MTPPEIYEHCGLRLRSEVELALPTADGEAASDVDVRWGADLDGIPTEPPGDIVAEYIVNGATWYRAIKTENEYVISCPDIGEFVVALDGSDVQVRRDPRGAEVGLVPLLVTGLVSAFVLSVKGSTVLHASAVAVNGRVLAFVGRSGAGKSTLGALMCVGGADLVADDLLSIQLGPPVRCIGGASELRLRTTAAPIVASDRQHVTRRTVDDRLAFSPPTVARQPLPLAAVVIPSPSRTDHTIEVRRLAPSQALMALLMFPRVQGWRDSDVLRRDFTALGTVVNEVPVFEVIIPWGPPFGPEIAATLTTLATGTG